MTAQSLNQERLKELVHYDPLTGIFTRLVSLSNSVKAGDVMGSTDDKGYLRARVDGHRYRLHRLAFLYMGGSLPPDQTDHKNHIRADNIWTNLRPATRIENQRNRSQNSNNTSGHAGVYWCTLIKKWDARIRVNGKQKYLGSFLNISDAIAARQAANIKYNFHPNHGK